MQYIFWSKFYAFSESVISVSFFFKAKGLDEMIDTTFMYWAANIGAWVPKLAHQMFAAGLKKVIKNSLLMLFYFVFSKWFKYAVPYY